MKILISLVLAVFMVLVQGCASSGKPKSMSPNENLTEHRIEPEARSTFLPAEQAFLSQNYEAAERGYRVVKTRFPVRTKAHMLASYRLGTIAYYQGSYVEAAREFEYFLQRYPRNEVSFDVTYNLAAAEYQLANYQRAQTVLQRLRKEEINAQGPRRAEIVYTLSGQSAAALNNHPAAVVAYASALALPLEESSRKHIEDKIETHLTKISAPPELEALTTEVDEPGVRSRIRARLAYLTSGGAAAADAPRPAAIDPGATLVDSGSPGGLPLGSSSRAERTNIGVLLPLTGRWAAYGRQALDGILLASRVFSAGKGNELKLFIEDTRSNPATAEDAVEKLVSRHNVAAIIGPFNWKEATAAADRAQQLGVMNISLSSREGISGKGAYLFQNALTPRIQMENLASYCINQKGMKQFGVLYPANAFGRDMANEFWSAVERLGGKVTAFQSYPADEKDFQSNIQSLVGLANPGRYRRLEMAKLNEYLKEVQAKNPRAKPPKVQLAPIVDFDALFVPDRPGTVAQIAASLAYFDVKSLPLLGTTEWNNDQLYKRGGKYVEGAIFPGGISTATKSERQRDFMRVYTDAYGSAPDLLAGQAYEAMELVAYAIRSAGSSDRNEMVQQLLTLRDYDTALGAVSFDSTRIAKRRVPIYTLDYGGSIVEKQ